MSFLFIGLGGFFGAICRYILGLSFNQSHSLKPFGTWIANISGSILLGILFVSHEKEIIHRITWLLFGVGFCGAYTTFSTFGTETLSMLLNRDYKKAIFYVFSSFTLSVGSVLIIILLVK